MDVFATASGVGRKPPGSLQRSHAWRQEPLGLRRGLACFTGSSPLLRRHPPLLRRQLINPDSQVNKRSWTLARTSVERATVLYCRVAVMLHVS